MPDSTVAILAVLALFVLPGDSADDRLLEWEDARRIPWGILILLGGGLALAASFEATGLSLWIGQVLTMVRGAPLLVIVFCVCLTITFLTEVTSNTATATIAMPVLAGLAGSVSVDPLILMAPGAVSASCVFMLPAATPPNAVVFGSGHLRVPQMARVGVWLNLLGILLTSLYSYLILVLVRGL